MGSSWFLLGVKGVDRVRESIDPFAIALALLLGL